MAVQFYSPAPSGGFKPCYVRCPPNRLVVPLCDPGRFTYLKLHWLEKPDGSFPCLGEECKHCPAYAFLYTYAPGMMWSVKSSRWLDGILCLGHPDGAAVQEARSGVQMVIGKARDGAGEKERISYLGRNKDIRTSALPERALWDPRPILLRRWGLFSEADLLGCDLHMPDPTLEFPSSDAG